MRLAVKDANVFIDLESMGLLDLWFQLGIETITSSFVVMELEDGDHQNALACIRAGQAIEAVISQHEMEKAFEELRSECVSSGLSITDISVMYLAIREDAILLSGDKQLRTFAKVRSVEIHGTLWIMDRLVEAGLLAKRVAAQRLENLLLRTGGNQRYLPKGECHTRITRWLKG